jgi:hypothetical protein
LNVGALNGANFFPGKLSQVAIYSAKVTQATIKASISQGLAGTETSLISAYSFNGVITDLNANANNLTANGSAVATSADSPFGTQASGLISSTLDYAIVQAATFSTNTTLTVQVPEGCTIPTSGGVSALAYSTQKAPYGMPIQRGKWTISTLNKTTVIQATPTAGTWYNIGSVQTTVPIGDWDAYYASSIEIQDNTSASDVKTTLSTGATTESDTTSTTWSLANVGGGTSHDDVFNNSKQIPYGVSLSSATIHYLNHSPTTASMTSLSIRTEAPTILIFILSNL